MKKIHKAHRAGKGVRLQLSEEEGGEGLRQLAEKAVPGDTGLSEPAGKDMLGVILPEYITCLLWKSCGFYREDNLQARSKVLKYE